MYKVGPLLLWLATGMTILSLFALVTGIRRKDGGEKLIKTGYRAAGLVFAFLSIASALLLYYLSVSFFRIEYVASYTSRDLPLLYKLTAFWAGQKGSLLLWGWLLSLFTVALLFVYRRRQFPFLPHAVAALMAITLFFGTLLVFVAPPFELLPHAPADGYGLNPLLQHPLMIIHPPLLFVGYVGVSVPFALALAILFTGRYDEAWVKIVRKWTIFPWVFLTMGIVIGAQWAYVELGWGGYWAWDPVENASLMPWLTATAFLHSIIVQEKKKMLKIWNLILIIITFELCIFGTFITRSGIIESVHAFGKSSIGTMFGIFLVTSILFCIWAVIRGSSKFRTEHHVESFVSRESAGIFNNIIFVAATLAVLWGTVYPLISELVQGSQISLGVEYYNQVTLPIAMVMLALTGIGPFLAWRKTPLDGLVRQFAIPLAVTVVGAVAVWLLGVRHLYAFMSFTLSIFVVATILADFFRSIASRMHHHQEKWYAAFVGLFARNQRRYAGHIVHFGMVLVFVGIAGSAFNQERQIVLTPGQSFHLGRYHLQFEEANLQHEETMHRLIANVKVGVNGASKTTLYPEKRLYFTHEQPMTEVALLSTWQDDLYLVLAGYEAQTQQAAFSAHVNPLVYWLWIGGWVIALGAVIGLLPLGKPSVSSTDFGQNNQKKTKPMSNKVRRRMAKKGTLAHHA